MGCSNGAPCKNWEAISKKVPEAFVLVLVQKLIDRYSMESCEIETFAVYIKSHLELAEWLKQVLLHEKQLHV